MRRRNWSFFRIPLWFGKRVPALLSYTIYKPCKDGRGTLQSMRVTRASYLLSWSPGVAPSLSIGVPLLKEIVRKMVS